MNIERQMLKGRLMDIKKQLNELDILASGLVISIRNYISPYIECINIQIEKAETNMKALKETIDKMKKLKEDLEKIEEGLSG